MMEPLPYRYDPRDGWDLPASLHGEIKANFDNASAVIHGINARLDGQLADRITREAQRVRYLGDRIDLPIQRALGDASRVLTGVQHRIDSRIDRDVGEILAMSAELGIDVEPLLAGALDIERIGRLGSDPCAGVPPGTPITDPVTGITTICLPPDALPPDRPPITWPTPRGGNGDDGPPLPVGPSPRPTRGTPLHYFFCARPKQPEVLDCVCIALPPRICVGGIVYPDGTCSTGDYPTSADYLLRFYDVVIPTGVCWYDDADCNRAANEACVRLRAEYCPDEPGEPGNGSDTTPTGICCPMPAPCPAPVVTCPEPATPSCEEPQYIDDRPWIACADDPGSVDLQTPRVPDLYPRPCGYQVSRKTCPA